MEGYHSFTGADCTPPPTTKDRRPQPDRSIVSRAAQIGYPIHPHALRHAMGFKLANDGVDTRAVQDYLAHKSIANTVRYSRLSPGSKPSVGRAESNSGEVVMGGAQPQTKNPAAVALQAKLNQGKALHRQGKLADAECCYGEVLQRQPNHFDALHLLGVIARQTRRTERGVELIKRAIGLNPNVAEAHNNLGNALMDLKRPAEALASYDKAIALKPDIAEAHSNRGNALMDLKRPAEALASYDKAIALKPDFAEAHSNRGNALMDLKRPAEALASYDKAIALKPDLQRRTAIAAMR